MHQLNGSLTGRREKLSHDCKFGTHQTYKYAYIGARLGTSILSKLKFLVTGCGEVCAVSLILWTLQLAYLGVL
jgi:hypothetical protein